MPGRFSGFRNATVDHRQIERWWRRWPTANIAIATGAASRLVVIDIDPRHDGHTTLANLQQRHGPLPETLEVATGGGGTHLYFAHPGRPIPNDSGRRLGPGIDIRGDGGYILAPPTLHASGHLYRTTNNAAPAELPAWIDRRLTPERRTHARIGNASSEHRRFANRSHIVGDAIDCVAHAPEGQRNTTLNATAYRLARLAQTGIVDPRAIYDALDNAARRAGLPERERHATLASAFRAAGTAAPHRAAGAGPFTEHGVSL